MVIDIFPPHLLNFCPAYILVGCFVHAFFYLVNCNWHAYHNLQMMVLKMPCLPSSITHRHIKSHLKKDPGATLDKKAGGMDGLSLHTVGPACVCSSVFPADRQHSQTAITHLWTYSMFSSLLLHTATTSQTQNCTISISHSVWQFYFLHNMNSVFAKKWH